MKKLIIFIVIILVCSMVGAGVYAYQMVRDPLLEQYERAEQYIKAEDLLQSVTDISYYHGTNSYYVVTGLSQDQEEKVVWVREDFNSHHLEFQKDGISEEDAISIVYQEDQVKEIHSVKLGFERGLPIYEVTYLNEDNRKGYYYVTFEDGTFMKRYVLRTD
ncbi:cell wall elongation regulator TseB-like domain-containing protein [Halalkalibacter krulwichiae]|uniref:Cell wall elongation regulator TseB-like domain-containing protein n=1 Tax=Halalkalibacter krulwichiae TaxID=199441 RepID=A0A1X9MAA8_9BACI|nr:DUF5590 domain-containing protein [Halalkalibacter krulwichiae]ARK30346.1 hypothetical protein BkAM31D_11195 [Halalkalibacter krulwichiae]